MIDIQAVYPAILTRDGPAFLIYIPDINKSVRGETLFQAMQIARYSISLTRFLPEPSDLKTAIRKAVSAGNFISPEVRMITGNPISLEYLYIDVDTDIAYRREN